MRKNFSFISGLSAFIFVFSLLFSNTAFAVEGEQEEYLDENVENDGVTEDSDTGYEGENNNITVPEDAYYVMPYIDVKNVDVNKPIILDYTEKVDADNDDVNLFVKFQDWNLEQVLEKNEDAVIVVVDGNVSIEIPASYLMADKNKAIAIYKEDVANSLMPIYDFSPAHYEYALTTSFEDFVYITFKVDPAQVINWSNVEVIEIENLDFKKEAIDYYEGTIKIATTTLGAYNIFEAEPNEDETVTDVVYEVYESLSSKEIDEKTNEIVLDYTGKDAKKDQLNVKFNSYDIKTVLEKNPKAKVVVKDVYVSTTIPLSLLESFGNVAFKTIPKYDVNDALGPVIDFALVDGNGEFITEFKDNPITLTFVINPNLVKNWDNVKVVYLDENGEMKEFLTPKSVDKVNGYVTVDVTHFSSYGVFEVASADTETPDTEGTKEETPSNNDSGQKLPATATDDYNLLASGLLLVVVSGVIFLVLNRKRVTNT